MPMTQRFFIYILLILLSACSHIERDQVSDQSLFNDIGGMPVIETIVDNFIDEIGNDKIVLAHFAESDIDRFGEKLIEQLCMETGGPCQYTGDTMQQVHAGMHISESEFNRTVDLLVSAMTRAGVSHPLQNRVLKRLAPMREDIIYQ